MGRLNIFFLVVLVSISLGLFSQETPMELITDRPDQTESANAVPKKSVQLETGFEVEFDNDQLTKNINFTYNTTLLRFGVFQNFELRLGFAYSGIKTHNILDNNMTTTNGFGPIEIGAKFAIYEGDGFVPAIGFLGSITLPALGHAEFVPSSFAPAFRFILQNELSDRLSMATNFGLSWDGQSNRTTFVYTLVLGVSIAGNLAGYIEAYGFLEEKQFPDHRIDGGFTYLIQNNFQLDLLGGIGLSEKSPNGFIGAGLSWRLPK